VLDRALLPNFQAFFEEIRIAHLLAQFQNLLFLEKDFQDSIFAAKACALGSLLYCCQNLFQLRLSFERTCQRWLYGAGKRQKLSGIKACSFCGALGRKSSPDGNFRAGRERRRAWNNGWASGWFLDYQVRWRKMDKRILKADFMAKIKRYSIVFSP